MRQFLSTSRWLPIPALAAMSLICSSCGKQDTGRVQVYPVHGKVLLEGKPVPHAFLVFHPVDTSSREPIHPRAQSKPDGTFAPSSYDSEDGAPAGDYVVTVERHRPPTNDDPNQGPNLLPGRYASVKTSKLKVRVVAGSNELEPFRIQRQAK